MGNYNNVTYNRDTDYRKRIDDAAAKGDYVLAGMLEQQRNAKIDGEKRTEAKTYDYSRYLEPGADVDFKTSPSAGSGTGITADDVDDDEGNGGRGYSYDASKDKTYQNLVKQVQKNAEFVGDNTLGRFSAMTGGIPSSYAVSAAANAQADVLDDIYDIYAKREAVDYSRYLDELDRENTRKAAEEDTRRWNLDYGLKDRQTAADVGYTEAKTAGQNIDNQFAPYIYLDELAGEGDTSTEADILDKANSGGYLTDAEYAMLDRAKENILAKVGAPGYTGTLTDEEMNILRAFGYTSGQLTGQIAYDSAASTFTAPEGEASAKSISGLINSIDSDGELSKAADMGSDSFEKRLMFLQELYDIDDDTAYLIYSAYANEYGW